MPSPKTCKNTPKTYEKRAEFLDLENVVLSPHIASGSESTRKAMAMTAANNLVEVLAHGRPPLNWVNRE